MPGFDHHFDHWEDIQKDFGFSQAVKAGNMVFISGTASLNPDFTVAHAGDFEAQLRFVYGKIGETLAHFGLDFSHVTREVMYCTDLSLLMNAVPTRKAFYKGGFGPASTAVEVKALILPEVMIEVETTAMIP